MIDSSCQKYVTVKNNIIHNIEDDVLHPGDMIASERQLTEMYSVSRITIRKALAELEHEGYLYKIQGKGTFIKGEKKQQNLFSLTSCTQDIIRLGMTPSRKVISAEIKSADKTRQEKLNISNTDKVFSLSRVYYADDEPINFTTTYLPYRYFKGIEKFDFSKSSLYDVIENKYDIHISRSVRTVEAVIANDDVCQQLGVNKGVALLLFKCITYGKLKEHEIPIETFNCYYRSDKFSFFINQVK